MSDEKAGISGQLSELDLWHRHQMAQRGHNPTLESLQRQFPGAEIVPFPQDSITVVAGTVNFVDEIMIPSGAVWFEVLSNNGVYVSRGQIVFPIANKVRGLVFQPTKDKYLARGVHTLHIGLINLGDVVTIAFHFQLFASNIENGAL